MRIKNAGVYLIFALIYTTASAQEKIKFSSINMGGLAVGENGNSILIQTLNGITYKKSFAGIGVGIDYYKNKTIPLFVDIRTSIGKTNLFVFVDPGYNFPFRNKPDEKVYYYNTYDFSGGFYGEFGVGYKMRLTGKSNLLFTSGYGYKQVNNKIGVTTQCLVGPCPVDYSTYKYDYQRILFKAGISL